MYDILKRQTQKIKRRTQKTETKPKSLEHRCVWTFTLENT